MYKLNKIRELRINKNISQLELAKLLNTSQQTISYYEQGKRDPDTNTLLFLSEYFGVSIDYILGNESQDIITEQIMLEYNSLSEESKRDFQKYLELLKIKDSKDKNTDISEKAQ